MERVVKINPQYLMNTDQFHSHSKSNDTLLNTEYNISYINTIKNVYLNLKLIFNNLKINNKMYCNPTQNYCRQLYTCYSMIIYVTRK